MVLPGGVCGGCQKLWHLQGRSPQENGILQYLHDRFGTILHYRGLKIGQRVIINTETSLWPLPLSSLCTHLCTKEGTEIYSRKDPNLRGEIPQRLMNKV